MVEFNLQHAMEPEHDKYYDSERSLGGEGVTSTMFRGVAKTMVSSQASGLATRGYLPLESHPRRGISEGAYRDKEENLPIESSVLTSLNPTTALKTWHLPPTAMSSPELRYHCGRIEQAVRTMTDSMAFYDSERQVATTTVSSQASGIIDKCLNHLRRHRTQWQVKRLGWS